MVYNKFTLGVIIRVLLIFAALLLINLLWAPQQRLFTLLILGIVVAGQISELTRFVNRTNRQLIHFVEAIENQNTTSRNVSLEKNSFGQLSQTYNRILETIQQAHLERESQYQLLETVVHQAQVGILLENQQGRLSILNPAAREILHLPAETASTDILRRYAPTFHQNIFKVEGNKETVFSLTHENGLQSHISAIRHSLRLMNQSFVLVTFQDIGREMEQKEAEAWHKLIRTLSHEIMNSVTPISSLTETGLHLLGGDNQPVDQERADKLKRALRAIERRSSGLYDFVNDVRQLIRIPEAKMTPIPVQSLLQGVMDLMGSKLDEAGIRSSLQVNPSGMVLEADHQQVEQVIINLITNAMEAFSDFNPPQQAFSPRLTIRAYRENSHLRIDIADNGKGLEPNDLEKVFIPFYSTKKSGSGIGLSLCRQIMHQHDGQVTVHSEPNKGSVFSLWFAEKNPA